MQVVDEEVLKGLEEVIRKIEKRATLPRIKEIEIRVVKPKRIVIIGDVSEEEAKELLKKGFEIRTISNHRGTIWIKKENRSWEEGFLMDEEQIAWIPELIDIPREIWERKLREFEEIVKK